MSKEWLNNIKISQELKDKIYYDEKNDLWVISWNAVGEALERTKKIEELLELYRKFGKQVDEFSEFAFSIYDEIQALEEELK